MIEADRLAIQKAAANVAMQRADADEAEATANGVKLDKLLKYLDGLKAEIGSRLDAVGARLDAVETKNKDERDENGERPNAAEKTVADETAALSEIQARMDSAYQEHSRRAAKPMQGESVKAYRLRMLRGLQRYSTAFKDADLSKIADARTLNGVEQLIFADSHEASMHPEIPAGQHLLEVIKSDRAGRQVSTFVSNGGTFIPLMSGRARLVKSILRSPRS